ncbi:hypothetical protein AVEN_64399-1 [Araneus ventricosus]|uniref:Uncharacterized protein n=1 Tax=Araneus ventricosus TaxID=182803 RepID=A0A4Y2KCB0_ARAVE|nr:hypothetical protein AVEN_64399-1 [Araneus ventricosus]
MNNCISTEKNNLALLVVRYRGCGSVTRKIGSTPVLPKHPGHLNDSRCNSWSTEAGVLIAYQQATARPLLMEVRTITGGGTQSPTITIPPGEASARLLIRRPLIRVLAVPSRGCRSVRQQWFINSETNRAAKDMAQGLKCI